MRRELFCVIGLLMAATSEAQVLSRPPAAARAVALPVLERVAAEHPDAWACAHVESRSCKADWINLAASALHALDARWGLNGKRGNANDVSMDVVTYLLDPANPRMVAAWDVCGGCGAPGARVVFNEITNYATIGQPGTAIWIRPEPVAGGGQPTPTPVPTPAPAVNLQPVLDALAALSARLDAVDAKADAASREALNAALRALELLDAVRAIPTTHPPAQPVTVPCMVGSQSGWAGGKIRLCREEP